MPNGGYSLFSSVINILLYNFKKLIFTKGIKTMVIGLRDNNGIVNTLSPLYISDIEQAAVKFLVFYISSINYIHFLFLGNMVSTITLQFPFAFC